MNTFLLQNWWALALRGVLAIVLGVLALLLPGITLAALVLLFAAYMLIDGIFAVIAGLRAAERHERWWPLVLEGVVDLLFAVVIAAWPEVSVIALVYLMGAWAVVTGVLLIAAAIRLHRVHGEWLLWLNGIVSVLFGLAILVAPIAGVLVLAWMIGFYALLFGTLMLGLALRLRHILHRTKGYSAARV